MLRPESLADTLVDEQASLAALVGGEGGGADLFPYCGKVSQPRIPERKATPPPPTPIATRPVTAKKITRIAGFAICLIGASSRVDR